MDGDQLIELIQRRHELLTQLLEFGDRQNDAIDGDRMTDLMRTLSDKQPLINQLSALAGPLGVAAGEDPASRVWASEQQRQQCRIWQDQCDAMHQQLLAIEAECEAKLDVARTAMQEKLQRVTSGRDAVNRYVQTQTHQPTGGSLDLSSN